MQTGQCVEKRGLAGVRISDDRDPQRGRTDGARRRGDRSPVWHVSGARQWHTSVERGERLDRDARSERGTKGEARAAHVEQHRMTRVDHTDIGAFTEAQCPQSTGFICRALDVDNRGATSGNTRRERARAMHIWLSLLGEGRKLFGGHDVS